jgi:hypothetical protein
MSDIVRVSFCDNYLSIEFKPRKEHNGFIIIMMPSKRLSMSRFSRYIHIFLSNINQTHLEINSLIVSLSRAKEGTILFELYTFLSWQKDYCNACCREEHSYSTIMSEYEEVPSKTRRLPKT